MAAHLAQIARVNPRQRDRRQLPDEACLRAGRRGRRARGARRPLGPLHGLPIAFKDLQDARGLRPRAARGSIVTSRPADAVLVERVRQRRRARHRQDQRAGVRPRLPHLQRGLRRDAQPLRPRRAPADRAAAPARRWPRACCRSPTAATSAARCATRPTSTTSSRCGPGRPGADRARSVSAPRIRRQRTDGALGGRRRVPAGRDGRARPARPRLRAVGPAALAGPRPRDLRGAARGVGARISADCRSIRGCAPCSTRSARPSIALGCAVEDASAPTSPPPTTSS